MKPGDVVRIFGKGDYLRIAIGRENGEIAVVLSAENCLTLMSGPDNKRMMYRLYFPTDGSIEHSFFDKDELELVEE